MSINSIYHNFSKSLLSWYDHHGRKELPWKIPRDAYRVWISEIMLQQTQVKTVIPYFSRFIQRFPTIDDLAIAKDDEVLSLWSGLGYYSRARNLHLCAKIIKEQHQGILPNDLNLLTMLPGIGRTTAAAILSQAYSQKAAILDANVKRILTRFFLIDGCPEQTLVKKKLWELADCCMPEERCSDYTQAIMDLGALCCTPKNPDCEHCPLNNNCLAFKNKQQALYPNKKIKKAIPVEAQVFLILYTQENLIYLEKKPPFGLWGGLWCLPALTVEKCPLTYIQQRYALKGEKPLPLLRFTHRFTHLQLNIESFSMKVEHLAQQVAEPSGQWFSVEELSSLGLAKPTSKILSQFIVSCLVGSE